MEFGAYWQSLGVRALVVGLALLAGCSKPPPQTRTTEQIFAEQQQLPAVYLTETGDRITAPKGKGAFVDEKSGKLAWPALACNRPDCPGRSSGGQPQLFIAPDPAMYVGPDGKIALDPKRDTGPQPQFGQCPACWKQRNPAAETAAQQQQYRAWVAPYVLPETAERLAELEAERKRRVRRDRHEAVAHE
jgi:hypothetical protein